MAKKNKFDYVDKKEKDIFKTISKIVDSSKMEYKNKLISSVKSSNINNNNYTIDYDITKTIKDRMENNFDELNVLFFKDVTEQFYNSAVREVEELTKEKYEVEYTGALYAELIAMFIVGGGLDYEYSREVQRRIDYFDSQMLNAMTASVNEKIIKLKEEYVSTHQKALVSEALRGSNTGLLRTTISQKKSLMGLTDNTAIFLAGMASLAAFKDVGVTKVLRVGIDDDKQCATCASLMNTVYDIENVPSVPTHKSCRCYYIPIIE